MSFCVCVCVCEGGIHSPKHSKQIFPVVLASHAIN